MPSTMFSSNQAKKLACAANALCNPDVTTAELSASFIIKNMPAPKTEAGDKIRAHVAWLSKSASKLVVNQADAFRMLTASALFAKIINGDNVSEATLPTTEQVPEDANVYTLFEEVFGVSATGEHPVSQKMQAVLTMRGYGPVAQDMDEEEEHPVPSPAAEEPSEPEASVEVDAPETSEDVQQPETEPAAMDTAAEEAELPSTTPVEPAAISAIVTPTEPTPVGTVLVGITLSKDQFGAATATAVPQTEANQPPLVPQAASTAKPSVTLRSTDSDVFAAINAAKESRKKITDAELGSAVGAMNTALPPRLSGTVNTHCGKYAGNKPEENPFIILVCKVVMGLTESVRESVYVALRGLVLLTAADFKDCDNNSDPNSVPIGPSGKSGYSLEDMTRVLATAAKKVSEDDKAVLHLMIILIAKRSDPLVDIPHAFAMHPSDAAFITFLGATDPEGTTAKAIEALCQKEIIKRLLAFNYTLDDALKVLLALTANGSLAHILGRMRNGKRTAAYFSAFLQCIMLAAHYSKSLLTDVIVKDDAYKTVGLEEETLVKNGKTVAAACKSMFDSLIKEADEAKEMPAVLKSLKDAAALAVSLLSTWVSRFVMVSLDALDNDNAGPSIWVEVALTSKKSGQAPVNTSPLNSTAKVVSGKLAVKHCEFSAGNLAVIMAMKDPNSRYAALMFFFCYDTRKAVTEMYIMAEKDERAAHALALFKKLINTAVVANNTVKEGVPHTDAQIRMIQAIFVALHYTDVVDGKYALALLKTEVAAAKQVFAQWERLSFKSGVTPPAAQAPANPVDNDDEEETGQPAAKKAHTESE